MKLDLEEVVRVASYLQNAEDAGNVTPNIEQVRKVIRVLHPVAGLSEEQRTYLVERLERIAKSVQSDAHAAEKFARRAAALGKRNEDAGACTLAKEWRAQVAALEAVIKLIVEIA